MEYRLNDDIKESRYWTGFVLLKGRKQKTDYEGGNVWLKGGRGRTYYWWTHYNCRILSLFRSMTGLKTECILIKWIGGIIFSERVHSDNGRVYGICQASESRAEYTGQWQRVEVSKWEEGEGRGERGRSGIILSLSGTTNERDLSNRSFPWFGRNRYGHVWSTLPYQSHVSPFHRIANRSILKAKFIRLSNNARNIVGWMSSYSLQSHNWTSPLCSIMCSWNEMCRKGIMDWRRIIQWETYVFPLSVNPFNL